MKRFWHVRELSTVAILVLEIIFFGWYLWPDGTRPHPFLNGANALLILKYSSIYGIAAVGAAVVIISGGIDLAPGSIIALASVVCGALFVQAGAFGAEANASRLLEQLRAQGIEKSFVREDRVDGRPLYRVRVGQYENPASAQATLTKLKAAGYSAVVVSDRQRERLMRD